MWGVRTISQKERVLNGIGNTRDWLDRAEVEYRKDAFLLGEMNLNLAQAELKRAWEESRKLHIRSQGEVIPFPPPVEELPTQSQSWVLRQSRHRYGMVAAAVLLLLLNLTPLLELTRVNEQTVPHTQEVILNETAKEQEVMEGEAVSGQRLADELRNGQKTPVAQTVSTVYAETKPDSSANRTVYTGTSLQFDVNKDRLAYIPVKEVKAETETASVTQPEKKVGNQFALEGRQLTSAGKRTDKWSLSTGKSSTNAQSIMVTSGIGIESAGTGTPEVDQVRYDVDQLVNLAKETLTTKR